MSAGLAQGDNMKSELAQESLDSWYRWSLLDLQYQRGEQTAAEYLVGLNPTLQFLDPEPREPAA